MLSKGLFIFIFYRNKNETALFHVFFKVWPNFTGKQASQKKHENFKIDTNFQKFYWFEPIYIIKVTKYNLNK